MKHGKQEQPSNGGLEAALAQWSEWAQTSFAPARDEAAERAAAEKERLEGLRETQREKLSRMRDAVEAQLVRLQATQHENEYSPAIDDLAAVLRGIDDSITALNSASTHQISAIIAQTNAYISAAGQSVSVATALASFDGSNYSHEMMDMKVAAFEAYAKEHGFNAALEASNFSYENSGVAHAYLRKHDEVYRGISDQLDQQATARNNRLADAGTAQDTTAKQFGVDLSAHDDAINSTKAELEEAEREGNINKVRDLQAQLALQTAAKEAALQAGLKVEQDRIAAAGGDTTAIDAAITKSDKRTDAIQSDVAQALAARDAQHAAFMDSMRKAGASEDILAQYQKDFDAATEKLSGMGAAEIANEIKKTASMQAAELKTKEEKHRQPSVSENTEITEKSVTPDATPKISGAFVAPTIQQPDTAIATSSYGMGGLSFLTSKPISMASPSSSADIAKAEAAAAVPHTTGISGGEDATEIAALPAKTGGTVEAAPSTITGGEEATEAVAAATPDTKAAAAKSAPVHGVA